MKVVNIVLCGKFSRPIDITQIPSSVYNPRRFSGAVCTYEGTTFLIFKNGSFVCLGAKKRKHARHSAEKMADLLSVSVTSCSIKNIVMAHKLGFSIQLDKVYEQLRQMRRCVTYENELFNGIVWKEGGGTVRLFHTGSFFVTGLRRKRDLLGVCEKICVICKQFKKTIKG